MFIPVNLQESPTEENLCPSLENLFFHPTSLHVVKWKLFLPVHFLNANFVKKC